MCCQQTYFIILLQGRKKSDATYQKMEQIFENGTNLNYFRKQLKFKILLN